MSVAGNGAAPRHEPRPCFGREPSLCRTLEGAKQQHPRGRDNDDVTGLPIPRWRYDGCCFARRWVGGLTIWSSAASEASPLQRRVRRLLPGRLIGCSLHARSLPRWFRDWLDG